VIRPDEAGNALLLGVQLKAPPVELDSKSSAAWDESGEVELCRMRHDPQLAPQIYRAWEIETDNFARCDATHNHSLTCDHTRHRLYQQPEFFFLCCGWLFCCVWLAVNHKTQKGYQIKT